jgi:2-polyprenyl-3-methyl-5-hydroxy-6-metoxy-1,4-benzoquinol methylase
MKSANEFPRYEAKRFMNLAYPVLEAQLVYSGLELGVFAHLAEPKTAQELSGIIGCDTHNLRLLLNTLTSVNYLKKENDAFQNLPDTDYYLNPKSEMYIGEHILYWRDMTSLDNLSELVKNGYKEKVFKDENGSDFFDFRAMGNGARNSMYTGRVQQFVKLARGLFDENKELKILDMGGGSGILSIELARNFKNSHAVVFDQPQVIEMTRKIIDEYGVSSQVSTKEGNFITDELGSGYDLIIASGVMDFVGELPAMASKLYKALGDSGYLYVSTHGINESFTAPARYLLGWLSSHLNGLDILKPDPLIRKALFEAGFSAAKNESTENEMVLKKK